MARLAVRSYLVVSVNVGIVIAWLRCFNCQHEQEEVRNGEEERRPEALKEDVLSGLRRDAQQWRLNNPGNLPRNASSSALGNTAGGRSESENLSKDNVDEDR